MELDTPDNPDLHATIRYSLDRLDSILEKNGARAIDNETVYAPLRHVPVPPAPLRKGTPIGKTLRKGWCIGGKVIRKARVEVGKASSLPTEGVKQ